MRGQDGVADEEKLVSVKFHAGVSPPCVPLTNIQSDWMSNASSGLCIMFSNPTIKFASWV